MEMSGYGNEIHLNFTCLVSPKTNLVQNNKFIIVLSHPFIFRHSLCKTS